MLVLSPAALGAAEGHRLGNEETARRFLFCNRVYQAASELITEAAAKASALDKAAKSAARVSALLPPHLYDMISRMAEDSFLEQMDAANRAGGADQRRRALNALEAGCDKHLDRYAGL
jgi:hypothetical protein